MAQIKISKDVRPISDMKARAAEIVRHVTETGRPIVLTRHGRGVAVVLSVQEYELLEQASRRLRLVEALREGEQDVASGRVLTHAQMIERWASDE